MARSADVMEVETGARRQAAKYLSAWSSSSLGRRVQASQVGYTIGKPRRGRESESSAQISGASERELGWGDRDYGVAE